MKNISSINLKFKTKLLLMCMTPIILISSVLGFTAINRVIKLSRTNIEQKLEIVSADVETAFTSGNEDYAKEKLVEIADTYEVTISIIGKDGYISSTNEDFLNTQAPSIPEGNFTLSDYICGTRYVSYYRQMNDIWLQVSELYDVYYKTPRSLNETLFFCTIVVFLFSAISDILLCIIFTKSMKTSNETLKILADGNLNIEFDENMLNRNDELGQIYKNTKILQDRFKAVIENIKKVTNELSSSIDIINDSTQACLDNTNGITSAVSEVAQGATQQAGECSDGSNIMAEVDNFINTISKKSQELKDSAQNMLTVQKTSLEALQTLNEQNKESEKSINDIQEKIKCVNDSITEVNKIVNAIQNIASQTNLLSLNASIEAAHAGEYGRGFAVVAGEIKNLAEQSSQLTKSIEEIIKELNTNSKETIIKMHDVLDNSNKQSDIVLNTTTQFEKLKENIMLTSNGVDDISNSVLTLSKHSKKLVDTITDLSAISEENAASAQECAASTEQLNEVINGLSKQVSILKQDKEELNNEIKFFK